jgi:protein involved in polysaccharide export with SLBB domain
MLQRNVSVSDKMIRLFVALPLLLSAYAPSAYAEPVPTQSVSTSAAPVASYRLGVADKIRLIVFNEPSLTGEFLVNADGTIALPLIGNVDAGGKTTAEVVSAVTTKFSDGYLRDPKISIEVLTYRPFYILGEVNKPGEYPYSNGLTVMNAVATAAGFTYRANKNNVYLKRSGELNEEKLKLSASLTIGPGDTIRISERFF